MALDPGFEVVFNPRSVAFVGVSSDPASKMGRRFFDATDFILVYHQLGFPGRIYPVNPKATEVLGHRAYPSLTAIPEPVDLVIIGTPARAVPEVLEDCITVGARNIHIFTSGFEETGEEEGRGLARRVREVARRGGLRLIGPNCTGLYVPSAGIGTYADLPRQSGPVALLAQSGGYYNWFCQAGPDYGFFFSKVISYGNAYTYDANDYLEFLARDPQTKVICLYLEGVKDGNRLLQLVKRVNREKPVIMLKGGMTEQGARAVTSHTGSLAGNRAAWEAFFKQSGAVRVDTLEEMADVTMTLLYASPPRGRRLGILTHGGASSVTAADICAREGLEIAELSASTLTELRSFITPAGTSIKNPLDLAPAALSVSRLERALGLLYADPAVDAVLIMAQMDMQLDMGMERVERYVQRLRQFVMERAGLKPTLVLFHPQRHDPVELELRRRYEVEFSRAGIPTHRSLPRAVRALARFIAYYEFLKGG